MFLRVTRASKLVRNYSLWDKIKGSTVNKFSEEMKEKFKGMTPDQLHEALKNPTVLKLMKEKVFEEGMPLTKKQIENLKATEDYAKVQRVKEFVDDLEENGTSVVPHYIGQPEIKVFLQNAVKSIMKN